MFQPDHTLIPALRALALLGALVVFYTTSANAQGVFSMTSELEVSGNSTLHAAATGLDPADADAMGNLRVAWHKAPVPGGGFEYDSELLPPLDFQSGIFVSTYSASGVSLQAPIRVDDPAAAGWALDPVLAADDLGRFVVLWRQAQPVDEDDWRFTTSIWMRAFDAQGIPLGAARKLTEETDVLPSIDMAGDGAFVIILGRTEPVDDENFDREPPRFWRFDSQFEPVDPFPRDVDTTLGRQPYSVISAVALNESGQFAVAYADSEIFSDTRVRRLRLRTFASDGAPWSEPVTVESTFVWGFQLRWLDNDRFVAAWLEGGRYDPITGNWQAFSRDGSPLGERMVSDVARGPGGILRLNDAEFALVWATESGAVLIPSTAANRSADIPLEISKTVSEGSYRDYYYGLFEEAASPISVVDLEGGEFAAVFMNTISGREMVRAGILRFDDLAQPALFDWSVVGPCVEDRMAKVRLNWTSAAHDAEITLAGPPAEKVFARVKGSGEVETGLWARHGMVFKLYDQATGELLATTRARPGADNCPIAPIMIEPPFFEVCDPRELSAGEVLWDATDLSPGGAEVRVNGIDGKLFARGGAVGSAPTGEWLRNGKVFYLLNPSTSEFLGTATVAYRQRACP